MDTWDTIRSRRNVRQYQDRPLGEDDLRQVLEAARRTPSSSNDQRWDFVVVQDRDRLLRLAEVWQGARHIGGSAATIALIAPDESGPQVRESIAYDLGQVTMSIMIAAADLGIGTGHSSVRDQEIARDVLGFPEGHMCGWLIGMGYPADRPLRPIRKPARRDFDDVVHWETW
jgi:nitroreductase